MSILITGGAGYIGSHTAIKLLEAGYDIVIIDDFSNSHPIVLDRIREITGKDFTFYEFNLCNAQKIEQVFAKESIEAVIHFAGFKAVGESVKQPITYYQNNLIAVLNVLHAMHQFHVNRIIFSSSATVYGYDNPVPFTEEMPISATNPYGYSKVFTEIMLADIAKASPDFCAVSLRYFNPVGAHASGKIGESPVGTPNNLMPYISQVAAGKLDHLAIFGNDYDTIDGTGVRDYIHVVDLARGHLNALNYTLQHTGNIAINLGTGQGYSVLEMVHAFEKANHVTIPYTIQPRRAGDIATGYADPTKAKQLLHWEATHTLEEMCASAWHWQKNNPNGYSENHTN
ncbi:UDP-glucose 4-epimerase GalE [Allofustis seminis]|uniref:UDP-glucose 4-epimerase GalE n=1 Tax=Allofustis seminis TaxID=166939 RepID=UPI00036FB9FC|nr:UDP-glucose 4-epimerase GalE [Allofustis seminis]